MIALKHLANCNSYKVIFGTRRQSDFSRDKTEKNNSKLVKVTYTLQSLCVCIVGWKCSGSRVGSVNRGHRLYSVIQAQADRGKTLSPSGECSQNVSLWKKHYNNICPVRCIAEKNSPLSCSRVNYSLNWNGRCGCVLVVLLQNDNNGNWIEK